MWSGVVAPRIAVQNMMARNSLAMQRALLETCVIRWWQHSYLALISKRFANEKKKRLVSAALDEWRGIAAVRRQQRARTGNLIIRFMLSAVTSALREWHLVAQTRRVWRRQVTRQIISIVVRICRSVLAHWFAVMMTPRNVRARIAPFQSRQRHAALHDAFWAWNSVREVLQRAQTGYIELCFDEMRNVLWRWRVRTRYHAKEHRKILARIVGIKRKVYRFWVSWTDQKAAAGCIRRRNEARAIGLWSRGKMKETIMHWSDVVRLPLNLTKLCSSLWCRQRRRTLDACFSTWDGWLQALQCATILHARILHQRVHSMVISWKRLSSTCTRARRRGLTRKRRPRDALFVAWAGQIASQKVLNRFAGWLRKRVNNSLLSQGFGAWREFRRTQQVIFSMALHTISRGGQWLDERSTWIALRGWRLHTRICRRRFAVLCRKWKGIVAAAFGVWAEQVHTRNVFPTLLCGRSRLRTSFDHWKALSLWRRWRAWLCGGVVIRERKVDMRASLMMWKEAFAV
eukprot:3086223-Rhodomonas_salina.1